MNAIADQLAVLRVVPVVALDDADLAPRLAEALAAGGLPCAEITLRTNGALDAIRRLRDTAGLVVGAGTVHSARQAGEAVDAGAMFVVTPGFNPRTVEWCLSHGVPVFPGIATPTDLESAIEFGLRIVKFFPAEALGGVKTLKAYSGPYGEMKFIPTGGISQDNLADYLKLDCVIACGGSWMVNSALLREQRFVEVQQLTAEAVRIARTA